MGSFNQNRVGAGVRAGGQYTTASRTEPDVELQAPWYRRQPAAQVAHMLDEMYHEDDPTPDPQHEAAVREKIVQLWGLLGRQRAGELADEVMHSEHLRALYASDDGYDRASDEISDEIAGVDIEDFTGTEPDPDGGVHPGYDFRAMADAVADQWGLVAHKTKQTAQLELEAAQGPAGIGLRKSA